MQRINRFFAVLICLSSLSASAAIKYFDPSAAADPATGGGAGVLRESGGIGVAVTVWRTATSGGVMTYWHSSSNDDADFRGTGGTMTMNNATPITVNSLTFRSDGYLFTMSGGASIRLTSGTINVVTAGHAARVSTPNGFLTINGAVNSGRTMIKAGAGKFRSEGVSTSYYDFDKLRIDGGTWEVNAASPGANGWHGFGDLTFASAMADWVTLTNGSTFSVDSALGTLTANRGLTLKTGGGTINITGANSWTLGGTLTGSTTLTKTGTGTLVLGTNNLAAMTGAIIVSAGVVAVANNNALGDAVAGTTVSGSGAAVQVSGTRTVPEPITLTGDGIASAGALRNTANNNTWSGPVTLAAAGVRINSDSGTLTLSGGNAGSVANPDLSIGGAGNVTFSTTAWTLGSATLTKDGAGTLTLGTDNSAAWSGPLVFSAGVLAITKNFALGTGNPSVTVPSASAVNVSGTLSGVTNLLTLNGTGVASAGALRNTANNNTWAGAISLGAIICRINSDSGTLTLTGGISTVGNSLTVGGAGNVTITTTGFSGNSFSSLAKDGAGTLTLTVASTFGGKTTATGGKISIFEDDALGPPPGSPVADQLTLNGASLEGNTTLALDSRRGITLAGSGGSLLAVTNTVLTCPNIVTGSALTNGGDGTVVLSGVNDYAGGTMVAKGTTVISGSSPLGTGPVTVSAGGTLAGSATIANLIVLNGTIAPGSSPGTLGTGGETWNGGGKYAFQINKADGTAGADPGWDLVSITGGLNLAPVLTNKFTIDISSLTASDVPGNMAGFNNTANYNWTLATTSLGVTSFDFNQFQITHAALSNALGAGRLFVGVTNSGNDLYVGFVSSNSAPSITVPVDQTMNELTTLIVTNTATDPDPSTVFTFRLISPPVGMAINPNSGVITWTPTEAQGPAVYAITAAVDDDGGTPLSATNTFNVTVNEVNVAPVFSVFPASLTNNELVAISNYVAATDADLPANTLTFTLVSPPAGMTITSLAGTNAYISWTPDESQGPSTNIITVVVTDTNPPAVNATSLSTTNTYTIVVNEVNLAPSFTTFPSNQTMDELTGSSNYVTAADADLPANTLFITLVSPPAGMTITSIGPGQSYILWTPSEAQGPTNALIKVAVTDNGVPAKSVTNSFTITVNEVNRPPVLPAQSDRTNAVASLLSVTNTATDPDLPANGLGYALVTAPAGALISASGIITWTPGNSDGGTTNLFTTVVTDTNAPAVNAVNLTATNSFKVVVPSVAGTIPLITSVVISGGTATVTWTNAVSGRNYSTQYKDNLTDVSWTDLPNSPVTASGTTATQDDTAPSATARYYRVALLP